MHTLIATSHEHTGVDTLSKIFGWSEAIAETFTCTEVFSETLAGRCLRAAQAGTRADVRMEDACRGAKLVIFVLTKDFLSSSWCMDEMRWTLEERAADLAKDPSNKHLQPEILTVLPEDYPLEPPPCLFQRASYRSSGSKGTCAT